ncbi:hypothetical protein C8034_v004318 [Colletotrichum sidae]|uniref:Uncharacterized protein n=1 Tax=Colletotrichum sidae TaxID=1347389 RepID=A0A4R8TSF2_9PEZI|nr:hypothetical protein C8034_v004318 [Colletotrichum sidae]
MKAASVIALFFSAVSLAQLEKPSFCPTVTTTGLVCPTFAVKQCLALSTISSRCGCPTAVPTATVNFPCGGNGPTGCGATEYIYDTATPTCSGFLTYQTIPIITPTVAPEPPLPTVCPTVYETGTVCGSCVQPACQQLSMIYNICGCPKVVPTVSVSYPCGAGCPGGCMGTDYIHASNTPTCTSTVL